MSEHLLLVHIQGNGHSHPLQHFVLALGILHERLDHCCQIHVQIRKLPCDLLHMFRVMLWLHLVEMDIHLCLSPRLGLFHDGRET